MTSSTPDSEVITGEMDATYTQLLANVNAAIQVNVEQNELRFSRFAILQPQSPQIARQEQGYKAGMIMDNLTKEVLSSYDIPPWLVARGIPAAELQKVHFLQLVPVFKLPAEFIHWKNRTTEGMGWHFKTLDPADPRVREGTWAPRGIWKNNPNDPASPKSPPVTENINMLNLVIDRESDPDMKNCMAKTGMIVGTYAKTSANAGKMLVTACNGHSTQGLSYWGRTYYLYTKLVSDDKNTYYVYQVATGPRLKDIAPGLNDFAMQFATFLTGYDSEGKLDKAEGRRRQEMVINAATLEEDEHQEGGAGGAGGGVDMGSNGEVDADDPFAKPVPVSGTPEPSTGSKPF